VSAEHKNETPLPHFYTPYPKNMPTRRRIWRGLILSLGAWRSVVSTTDAASQDAVSKVLRGKQPDPFVQRAPLVVAMACRDGVALIAAHPEPNDDEDALLYDDLESDAIDRDATDRDGDAVSGQMEGASLSVAPFRDLPLSYEGPLRIHSIGTQGAALVSCGWGADGSGRMVHQAREFCSDKRLLFGQECLKMLPMQLSLFMAECAVSGVRWFLQLK
jgi:hypothetical protein